MHTMTLLFRLCKTMRDFPSRMYQLCLALTAGIHSPTGISLRIECHIASKGKPPSDNDYQFMKKPLFEGVDVRIFVDCLEYLDKLNMEAADIPVIREAIEAVIAPLGISIEEFALERIDYCQNVIVPSQKERELLMFLWHKASKCHKKLERINGKDSATANKLYYKRMTDNYRVQLYDKELERRDKEKNAKPYELGVLRLESQLHREHLMYHWWQYRTPRSFDVWADWSLRAAYLRQTEHLFFPGDFYTLRRAETLLRKAGLSPKECQEIRQFMKNISESGFDYAEEQAKSTYLVNKYINQLTSLGISPIPIPQNARTPYLANPFRQFYERGCV